MAASQTIMFKAPLKTLIRVSSLFFSAVPSLTSSSGLIAFLIAFSTNFWANLLTKKAAKIMQIILMP